jgi:thiamine biosynthesis lipoprotein
MRTKILYLITVSALILTSCADKKMVFSSFSGFTQGTTYSIIFENSIPLTPAEVKVEVENILLEFDNSLSTYNPMSLITAINNNQSFTTDSLFTTLFIRAKEIWEMTDGSFDITAGPLVNAWGFGPDSEKRFEESALDSLLSLVGMEKISIVDGVVVKDDPGMYLDVNAIAQGYSVDVLCDYLDKLGVESYLVEVGGEVRARGTKNRGEKWTIGIDKPVENNFIAGSNLQIILSLENRSLATSGNYRRFYVDNVTGVKYSHTIDPKTGYPVRHKLLSATIITDDCMTADAFATACMVVGLESAIEIINRYPFLDGYLIFSDDKGDFKSWYSEGIREYMTK